MRELLPTWLTNGLFHELGSNGRVDTARNGTNYLRVVTNEVSDAGNLLLDEVLHLPAGLRPTDIDSEVAQKLDSARCLDKHKHLSCE